MILVKNESTHGLENRAAVRPSSGIPAVRNTPCPASGCCRLADLGVGVHLHLVHAHGRLVVWQSVQQPQGREFRVAVGVLESQPRLVLPPDQTGGAQSAAGEQPALGDPVELLQAAFLRLAAPRQLRAALLGGICAHRGICAPPSASSWQGIVMSPGRSPGAARVQAYETCPRGPPLAPSAERLRKTPLSEQARGE